MDAFCGCGYRCCDGRCVARFSGECQNSVPKFANGGIAYGPTLGLFGEYAGASTNPEVVAPLDKLRNLLDIDSRGGGVGGRVEFEIKGRNLVGVLRNEQHRSKRNL